MSCAATAFHFYSIDISENFMRISAENIIKMSAAIWPKIANCDKVRVIQLSAVFLVQLDLLFSLNSARKSSMTG